LTPRRVEMPGRAERRRARAVVRRRAVGISTAYLMGMLVFQSTT
jgi:hypothetical protein